MALARANTQASAVGCRCVKKRRMLARARRNLLDHWASTYLVKAHSALLASRIHQQCGSCWLYLAVSLLKLLPLGHSAVLSNLLACTTLNRVITQLA
eukprot:150932-Amphidinium_carterae.1